MKFATERDGSPDGRLLVVSRDLSTAVPATGIAANLQEALDRWTDVLADLESLYDALNSGTASDAAPLDPARLTAPLPRAWQWLGGSVFASHLHLMTTAYNIEPVDGSVPLMYQGMSHQFVGANEPVPMFNEAGGIDFEGEIGIITDHVPAGTKAEDALGHIRLLVQINDWSLRVAGRVEFKKGYGWIEAKPACSLAPIAVTPDEFDDDWKDGRLTGRLEVKLNGKTFGSVPTEGMTFGFQDIIAQAAKSRFLCTGTVIGSGTVSSSDWAEVGSCCIAERRAIETIEGGSPVTPFMSFGDRVEMTALIGAEGKAAFGTIDQVVVETAAAG